MNGLYVHVPLCISRCRYCDFYKLTPGEWDDLSRFIRCLDAELARLPDAFAPGTVFIGGGTPTALEPEEYRRMMAAIRQRIDLSRVVEFTSEANPGTLTDENLDAMRAGGVNRISIGVQSFNEKALRLLGRIHSSEQADEAFRQLRRAGFDNINIDLIQGIPGMRPADVLEDVRRVVALGPEHISCYNLIYEPGTPLMHDLDAGKIAPPGDEQEAEIYFAVKEMLEQAGYLHYEISNFAREGRECLHNLLYWQGGDYFGCGPSAHSHWGSRRFGNVADLRIYCERLEAGAAPFDESECLPPEEKARETLVMWLRLVGGVELDRFRAVTGFGVDELCGDAIRSMVEEGLLARTDSVLALTRNALFVSNSVFSELV